MTQQKNEEKTHYLELKEAFNVFDKDNDGFITVKELGTVMRSLGYNPSAEELHDLIKVYDKDDSGTIDLSEFMELMNNKMREQAEEKELIETFEVFDRNGDGLLSKEELKYVMESIGEHVSDEILDEFIRQADIDEDGNINYQEFVKLMTSK